MATNPPPPTVYIQTRDDLLGGAVRAASTALLLAELESRGELIEEWDVALVTSSGAVVRRYPMEGHAQATGVCRDWRIDCDHAAEYVVERRLATSTFTRPDDRTPE